MDKDVMINKLIARNENIISKVILPAEIGK